VQGLLDLAAKATDTEADRASDEDVDGQETESPASKLLRELLPLVAPPDGQKPGAGTEVPLSLSQLNAAMAEEIVWPLVEELELLDALELRFDERETNLAQDRLGLIGDVQLRSTPWAGPAKLRLNVSARVERRPQQSTRGVIAFDVDLRTDTVAMLDYFKQRALARLHETREKRPLSEDEAASCRVLEASPEFASLTDVSDFIPRKGEVDMHSVLMKIDRLKAEMDERDRGSGDRKLLDDLAAAYQRQDLLMAFSIRAHRDSTLGVNEIIVTLPGGGVSYRFVNLEAVDMHLTETALVGRTEVTIGQAGVLVYQGVKSLVIEPMLRRLQERDPRTIQNLRRSGRQLGRQFKEL
jgi:hypothetical protein